MLCDKCKIRQAVNYKSAIVEGKKVFLHLCQECSNDDKENAFHEIKIGEKLFSQNQNKSQQNIVCPVCFSSLASIKKTGKLGCGNCYKVFKQELIPSIQKVQDSHQHTGKIYGKN